MKYFIANWKMNMTKKDVVTWFETWSDMNITKQIIVAPSTVHLQIAQTAITSRKNFELKSKVSLLKIELATQDVSEFEKGAHTGENGAFQLKQFCTYAIIGHSERKEPYETIMKKAKICLKNNITPIICFVNPTEANKYYLNGCLLAWEDPTNISKNGIYKAKDPKDIATQILKIKKTLPTNTQILYGGSVNNQNIKNLKEISSLDGVLVGNASLDAKHFSEIVNA